MLYSHCSIIYICNLYIWSGVLVFVFILSLCFLCPVSLSFLSFTRPTLSRKVPPCKPGPAQGFFLLNGSFSLLLCLPGGSGPGFSDCKAPRDNCIVKDAIQIKKLNWNMSAMKHKIRACLFHSWAMMMMIGWRRSSYIRHGQTIAQWPITVFNLAFHTWILNLVNVLFSLQSDLCSVQRITHFQFTLWSLSLSGKMSWPKKRIVDRQYQQLYDWYNKRL